MSIREIETICRNSYIATLVRARKEYECNACGYHIEPHEEYYEVVKGGGGLGWLKHPYRVHTCCINEFLEIKGKEIKGG